MAELMEINSISVEQLVRRSRISSVSIKPDPTIVVNPPGESRVETVGRYISDYRTR